MRNERAVPIIESLLDYHDKKQPWRGEPTTTAASRYTSQAHLDRERTELFAGRPLAVALSPDLPAPGTRLVRDKYDVPLLLTRDTVGAVHAFANVCQHRGAQVLEGCHSKGRRMSCPYHGWTYDVDGTLVSIPDRESFPADVPTGLRSLPVVESDGVIWVEFDLKGGPSLEAPELGAIADDFATFDISGHRHWRAHRFDLELNWKLVIDTFLEPYHFASLHKNTVGPIFMPNLGFAEREGLHLCEVLPRRSLADLKEQPKDEWDVVPHSAMVYVLFPSTVFVMQIDHLETWRVLPYPDDPSRSICDLDFYVPDVAPTDSSERHWENNWKLTIDTVINEDFHAMAGLQRGLESGALDELLLGANEPALSLFHRSLEEALR